MSDPSNSVVAELAGMRRRTVELAKTLWAAHDAAELMDVVAEAESLKSTLDALQLEVVRELEATQDAKHAGWTSTHDFLTHASGGHKGSGPAMVRLATVVSERRICHRSRRPWEMDGSRR